MAEYWCSAHATFDLKYHLIWITKYRYKILRGRVAERARDLIRQVCQSRNVVVIRGAVSPDHIHILVSAPPELSPSKLVQYIKRAGQIRKQGAEWVRAPRLPLAGEERAMVERIVAATDRGLAALARTTRSAGQ